MKITKAVLNDFIKALLSGLISGIIIGSIFFVIGYFVGSKSFSYGLEICKSALLIMGAVGLLIIAGMLLVKGKKPERFSGKESWKHHFTILGYKSVISIFALSILLLASIADLLT